MDSLEYLDSLSLLTLLTIIHKDYWKRQPHTLPQEWVDPKVVLNLYYLLIPLFVRLIRWFNVSKKSWRGGGEVWALALNKHYKTLIWILTSYRAKSRHFYQKVIFIKKIYLCAISFKCHLRNLCSQYGRKKLDRVGPVDNRPSTE